MEDPGREARYLSILRKHQTDFMTTIVTMNVVPNFLKR